MFKSREKLRKHALSENDKNKIKRKRGESWKQTEFHSNAEYKFASKDDLEENANQMI